MSNLSVVQTFLLIGVLVGAVGVFIGMVLLFWALIRPQSSMTTQKAGKIIMYFLILVFLCYSVILFTSHS